MKPMRQNDWNDKCSCAMKALGRYALPWGVETYRRFGAGCYGAALLDLMVGEPVGVCNRFSELKAAGPSRTVSNSPITKSQRGIVCGRRTADTSIREDTVPGFEAAQEGSLEARTIAAHRAYVIALVAWEQTVHRATCRVCRSAATSQRATAALV